MTQVSRGLLGAALFAPGGVRTRRAEDPQKRGTPSRLSAGGGDTLRPCGGFPSEVCDANAARHARLPVRDCSWRHGAGSTPHGVGLATSPACDPALTHHPRPGLGFTGPSGSHRRVAPDGLLAKPDPPDTTPPSRHHRPRRPLAGNAGEMGGDTRTKLWTLAFQPPSWRSPPRLRAQARPRGSSFGPAMHA